MAWLWCSPALSCPADAGSLTYRTPCSVGGFLGFSFLLCPRYLFPSCLNILPGGKGELIVKGWEEGKREPLVRYWGSFALGSSWIPHPLVGPPSSVFPECSRKPLLEHLAHSVLGSLLSAQNSSRSRDSAFPSFFLYLQCKIHATYYINA